MIAPFVVAPGNRNETILLAPAISSLRAVVKLVGLDLKGSIMSLDGAYNSRTNRKAIFNLGMTPNAPENKRNRKKSKRGKKQTDLALVFGTVKLIKLKGKQNAKTNKGSVIR